MYDGWQESCDRSNGWMTKEKRQNKKEDKGYNVSGIGLIQVEKGWTGFSEGWQVCSEGFPDGKARGKSRGAALPA